MKIKSEKGYTGIDIAVSVIVIFIFVSLISILIYNFNSKSKEIELKSEATYIAIDEIEKIKNEGYDLYKNMSEASGNSIAIDNEEIKEGYYETVTVIDYTDIDGNQDEIPNLVKKVTVKISYIFKTKEQSVELSTIISKEN